MGTNGVMGVFNSRPLVQVRGEDVIRIRLGGNMRDADELIGLGDYSEMVEGVRPW